MSLELTTYITQRCKEANRQFVSKDMYFIGIHMMQCTQLKCMCSVG